jgi:hypothetical protein
MFDRYPDGGVVMPTPHAVFVAPLAQITLIGAVFVLVRAWRDLRLAVLSVWFWLGLSGVTLTVETPNYLRAVGLLPSLCFVLALTLVAFLDRLQPIFDARRKELLGVLVPAGAAVVLLVPEVGGYFGTFRTMPSPWAPETHEGQVVAAMGATGPVYSMETQEHTVNSGWVRFLAPDTEKGRVPNPGRELPILAPIGIPADPRVQRPNYFPAAGQGFSVLMTPDPNQRTYVSLLQQLYPGAILGDGGGDQRQSVIVPSAVLDAVDGVTVVDSSGALRAVQRFGEIPAAAALPATLTWRAGLRLPTSGTYTFATTGGTNVAVRVDGIAISDHTGEARVFAAGGVHLVELTADMRRPDDRVALSVNGAEPQPRQLYRLMDAPWGLLARPRSSRASDVYLDATISMAFWDPELSFVVPPTELTWSGTLLAPSTGTYRFAFAAEDPMRLELDGQTVDVVTVKPDDWRTVAAGSTVNLTDGPHRVQVTLTVTHSGREAARWNWVPPLPGGAADASGAWSVVPPWVLRPDPSVSLLP